MAKIDELKGIYDIPKWFSDLHGVNIEEAGPTRDLILVVILGIRSWVDAETERVKSERKRPFDSVHGLGFRNKMDQLSDMLWWLNAAIEEYKGIFTTDDRKWGMLDRLQKECSKTIEVIHTARSSFHPPII